LARAARFSAETHAVKRIISGLKKIKRNFFRRKTKIPLRRARAPVAGAGGNSYNPITFRSFNISQ